MGIYESIRDVVTLAQKVDNIELYRKILDLQAELQQLMDKLREREDKIRQKDEEIAALKDSLSFKGKLVRYKDAYRELDDKGDPCGDPLCQYCWETNYKAVHLAHGIARTIICPHCKNVYMQHHVL